MEPVGDLTAAKPAASEDGAGLRGGPRKCGAGGGGPSAAAGAAAGGNPDVAASGGSAVQLSDAVNTTAALIMFLSPGVATSFYVVMVGYYQNKFHTPVFFLAMLFAVYGPYPVVSLVQASFDSYFDRHFSTRVTYPSRIVFSQSLMLTLTLIWMYTEPSMRSVVWIGVLLGSSAAVANASGHQLISAIDPKKLVHAEIGNQLGQALPLLVFYVARFQPTATDTEFRHVLCTIVAVCALSIGVVAALHFAAVFERAYVDLSIDLAAPSRQETFDGVEMARARQCSDQVRDAKLLDEPVNLCYEQAASRPGEADREVPVSIARASPDGQTAPATIQRSIPRWVYIWMTTKMCTTAVQASVMSLAAFFGGPNHTQFLACAKLAAELLGRVLALPVCKFSTEPRHGFLATTVAIRVLFAICFYADLRKVWLSNAVFTFMWSSFAFLDRFAMTLVDVTAGANVETRDRKFVSRVTFAFGFAGLVLGLAIALAIVIPLKSSGPDPPSPVVEPHGQEALPGVAMESFLAVGSHARRVAKAARGGVLEAR